MTPIFFDTWAFMALTNRNDPDHDLAVHVDEELERMGADPVTSDWIIDETVTGLHARAGYAVSISFLDELDALVAGDLLTVLHVSETRRAKAVQVFRRVAKDTPKLSLTDCTSFTLMIELGIQHAFTADAHFAKAGKAIRPLLKRDDSGLVFKRPA